MEGVRGQVCRSILYPCALLPQYTGSGKVRKGSSLFSALVKVFCERFQN